MAKKPHPVDVRDREKISSAVSFNVHIRRGPSFKINHPAKSLIEAARAAEKISAENDGKPCMVYGIMADGSSTLVPPDMIAEILADEAMKQPLTGVQLSQLTAVLTGGGFKRARSRDAAATRFVSVAVEKGFDAAKANDLLDGPFDFAEHIIREHVSGKSMTIAEVKANPHAASNALIANAIAKDPELAAMVKGGASRRMAIDARDGAEPAKVDDYPAPAAKPEKAKPARKGGAVEEAAKRGELPSAPDFSAETHRRYRAKLAEVVALADARDLDGLKAYEIKVTASTSKALERYRNLCVTALEAQHS